MIEKIKEGPVPSDKLGKAGHEAEMQMAFYLRRAFAESSDVFVFNDLRFVRNGEVAQIDHLVLHRYGFFLIESKSVTGAIEVNKQLEFTRVHGRQRRGMKSPLTQVKMQADLFRQLLNDQKEDLRRKVLLGFMQSHFGEQRFATLVAISDGGEIKRKGCKPPNLIKADGVTSIIQDLISRHDKTQGITGMVRIAFADKQAAKELKEAEASPFTPEELSSIKRFLLDRHEPFVQPPPVAQPTVVREKPPQLLDPETSPRSTKAQEEFACGECSSREVAIVYGRYGYYFKCRLCSENTKIDFSCPNCGNKAKISKRGTEFRWKCSCGNDSHFFTNPE